MRRHTVGALTLTFASQPFPFSPRNQAVKEGAAGHNHPVVEAGKALEPATPALLAAEAAVAAGHPPAAVRWVPPPSHLLRRRPECPACRRHLRRLQPLRSSHPRILRIAARTRRARDAAAANRAAAAAKVTALFLEDRANPVDRTGRQFGWADQRIAVDVERQRGVAGFLGAPAAGGPDPTAARVTAVLSPVRRSSARRAARPDRRWAGDITVLSRLPLYGYWRPYGLGLGLDISTTIRFGYGGYGSYGGGYGYGGYGYGSRYQGGGRTGLRRLRSTGSVIDGRIRSD